MADVQLLSVPLKLLYDQCVVLGSAMSFLGSHRARRHLP